MLKSRGTIHASYSDFWVRKLHILGHGVLTSVTPIYIEIVYLNKKENNRENNWATKNKNKNGNQYLILVKMLTLCMLLKG